jgi:hypothetical protein
LLDGEDDSSHDDFSERVMEIHDRLSLLKNTYIPKGMHIFGRLPEGEKLSDFVYAIARYENTPNSLRGVVTKIISRESGLTGEELEAKVEEAARAACRDYVQSGISLDRNLGDLYMIRPDESSIIREVGKNIHDVVRNVFASDEMASFLNGFQRRIHRTGSFWPRHQGEKRRPAFGKELLFPRPPKDTDARCLGNRQDTGKEDHREIHRRRGKAPGKYRFLLAVRGYHVGGRRRHGADDVSHGCKTTLAE